MGPTQPPQQTPPLASTESLIRRNKPIWRLLLICNLAIGGYIFVKAGKKKSTAVDNKITKPREDEVFSGPTPASPLTEVRTTLFEPMQVREPIPEDQQHQILENE